MQSSPCVPKRQTVGRRRNLTALPSRRSLTTRLRKTREILDKGETTRPRKVEQLAATSSPLRWRHERRRRLDSLVQYEVAVSRFTCWHASCIFCHCQDLLRILKIAERRVGELDRLQVERVSIGRRGIE